MPNVAPSTGDPTRPHTPTSNPPSPLTPKPTVHVAYKSDSSPYLFNRSALPLDFSIVAGTPILSLVVSGFTYQSTFPVNFQSNLAGSISPGQSARFNNFDTGVYVSDTPPVPVPSWTFLKVT